MAKRLFDTGLVSQTWYQDLSPKGKALYIHLLCICDVAGVFETNYRMMSAYIGEKITEADVFDSFGRRVIPLTNHESKGIIVDFIGFQCGGVLNPRVKVHASILKRLNELGITVEQLASWATHPIRMLSESEVEDRKAMAEAAAEQPAPAPARAKPHQKPKSSFDVIGSFDIFYGEYPRHDSKQVALIRFSKIMEEMKSDEERKSMFNRIMSAVRMQKQSEQWQKENGRYIPMPSTWLNQRRWEDEGTTIAFVEPAIFDPNGSVASSIISKMRI